MPATTKQHFYASASVFHTAHSEGYPSLPARWKLLSFDEAIEPMSDEGKRVDQADYLSKGMYPVIDQGEQFIGGYTDDTRKVYGGPLPVIVFGDHTRRIKFVDFRFAVGAQGVKLLHPRECWFPKFFSYLLSIIELPDRGYGRHYQYVRKLAFPVPSEPSQRQIVAEIEKQFARLDAGVAALRRVQANLYRYRAAVLKAACEGRLIPAEAKWPRKRLGDVTSKIGSGSTPRGGENVYRDSGIPLIRSMNVHSTGFRFEGLAYIDEAEAKKLDHVTVKSCDVLLNITGASIGRVTTVPTLLGGARVNQHVCIIRPNKELSPAFLSMFLASPIEQARVMNVQVGATRQALTKAMVTNWEVPVPSLAEQERIVAEVERRLSVVEELAALVTANLKRADRLRQSILHRAFEGKLVAQEQAVAIANVAMPKPAQSKPPNRHFVRALLSAEIIHQLHAEPTFGRIKHQKIFHLCEHIARIEEIQGQYYREAAGPLDNRLIYTNEAELKKQKWYQTVPRESFGHAYEPMAKAGGHRKYLERCWPDKLPLIERLIKLMREWDTDRCEIFSTAYAAWNDMILWNKEPTEDAILDQILNHWHDSKKRFPAERWHKAIAWMRGEGFIPTGFGKPTKKRA